jgi:DNA-binding protein WhiA
VKSRNLLATIRTNLSLLPIEDNERAYSELVGLSLANSFVNFKGGIIASFENAPAARRMIRILDVLGIQHTLSSYVPDRFGGVSGHKYEVIFHQGDIYKVLLDHDYIYDMELLPVYFLRGLFLARGNIYISTRGGYRLTFASRYKFALSYASDLLSELHISFAMQKRQGKDIWFLHVMKFDEIISLLKLFGLKKDIEKLQNIYETREIKKSITRITNIEMANLKRVSYASSRQIKKLSRLTVDDVPSKLVPLWRLRISPEGRLLSYREIAERLGWTKAKVSRGLKKLEKIADDKDTDDI